MPCVIYDPEAPEGSPPYKMWYAGYRDVCDGSIGYATSTEGYVWIKNGKAVLEPSPGAWDNVSLVSPSVIFDRTQSPPIYRMWYDGHGVCDCAGGGFGYASSLNGIDWTRYEGNPVLTREGADNPTTPKVLFDEDSRTFEMWYSAQCTDELYYATSLDGITWTKYPKNHLSIAGYFTGPVLRDGDFYHRIYNSGPPGNNPSFLYASSPWTLPRASFTVSPETGIAPLEVTVDASRSTTPADSITRYSWDFGDGATAEGIQVNHAYTRVGEYLLKLTVTDSAGKAGSNARRVFVAFPREPVDPWTGEDIGPGAVSGPGGTRPVGECLEVLGGVGAIGVGLTGSTDRFHFVHQKASGDFCLTAHVSDWTADLLTSSIGLMARASLAPGAPEASVNLQKTSSGGRYHFQTRLVENGSTQASSTVTGNAEEAWLRLARRADEFIASTSLDGTEWAELGRATVVMPQQIEVGIAAADGRSPNGRDYVVGRVCSLELVISCETRTFFHRGDPNANGATDISDGIAIFEFLFLGAEAPTCNESADANNDGAVDISDGIYLLGWLFTGGPEPAAPGPAPAACGVDPDPAGSGGDLGCESYSSCE
jgi:regulation of enolase protein 1 (concanavalin A-like superfamily)